MKSKQSQRPTRNPNLRILATEWNFFTQIPTKPSSEPKVVISAGPSASISTIPSSIKQSRNFLLNSLTTATGGCSASKESLLAQNVVECDSSYELEAKDKVPAISKNIALRYFKFAKLEAKRRTLKTSSFLLWDVCNEVQHKFYDNRYLREQSKRVPQNMKQDFLPTARIKRNPVPNLMDSNAANTEKPDKTIIKQSSRDVQRTISTLGQHKDLSRSATESQIKPVPWWVCHNSEARKLLWDFYNAKNCIRAETLKRKREAVPKTKLVNVKPFSSLEIESARETLQIRKDETVAGLKEVKEVAGKMMKLQKIQGRTGILNDTMTKVLKNSQELAEWSLERHKELTSKDLFKKPRKIGRKLSLQKISNTNKQH